MFCKQCGKQIDDDSLFCRYCGTGTAPGGRPSPYQMPQQPVVHVVNSNVNNVAGCGYVHRSKWTAFFLCLFLGFLGVHRFYVGKNFTGLIWLFSGGLGGAGWAFDLLLILIGAFTDKAAQPLV